MITELLLTRLWMASLHAGVFAAAVWLLCRLAPRMPAAVRAALWWLVCAKFLITVLLAQSLALPLLPARAAASASDTAETRESAATRVAAALEFVTTSPAPAHEAASVKVPGRHDARGSSTLPRALRFALTAVWIGGVWLQFAWMYRAHRRTRAAVRGSTPADSGITALARNVSARLGVADVPVRTCTAIETPQVTGVYAPVILLPPGASQLPRADLEMTLCHELLHVRRGDLWTGWLPSLAQRVFFFHPLAWIAAREYALAREAACDAGVLRVLGSAPDAYGALLLRLGVTHAAIAPLAVGASGSFRTLKRRLIMLTHATADTRARQTKWWLLAAAIALAIVPIRVVAQAPPAAPAVPAAPSLAATSDAWAALKESAWTAARSFYDNYGRDQSDRDAWVLLHPGDGATMSGNTRDIAEARRQRTAPDERLLWFRHDGKAYVIRDPSTLEAVNALFAPISKLGEQQGELGNAQGKFGDKQRELGNRQARLGDEMAALGAKLNDLTATQLELSAKQMRDATSAARAAIEKQQAVLEAEIRKINDQMMMLGHQQEELGRQQEALGREQEQLGRQQETLGHQEEQAARQAERQVREIMERAIASGLAQPAR